MNRSLRTLITATTSLLLGSAAVLAQTPKPAPAEKASAWVQGRTPDGQPDMQGTWTNASNVPLERPKDLGAKEVFTEQEKAEYEKRAARGFIGDRAKLPEAHYDQAQFGLDPSQAKFARNLRTSMIYWPGGKNSPVYPGG